MGKLLGVLIGVGAGSLAGGLWWVLLPLSGLALGHYFDARTGFTDPDDPALHDRGHTRAEIDQAARAAFGRSLAGLFVQLAQVDGEMTRQEARAIRAFFEDSLGLDAAELERVRQALQAARGEPEPLERLLQRARGVLAPSERSLLLYALAQVGSADQPLTAQEKALLHEMALGLELSGEVAAAMLAEAQPEEAPEPYERLGLTPEASDAEVKRAYRALAQTLHPDKVGHLGPQAVALAGRAFSEVSEAYETIRRARGL